MTSTTRRRSSDEKSANCSFCLQRPRERNDLCNRCRQKVEARANKLLEQKVHGDIACILQAVTTFIDEIPTAQLSETQQKDALKELIPLYTVRKQSEYQYKGRKGNTCWCLPDRIFREAVYFLVPGADTEGVRDRTGLTRKLTSAIEAAMGKYQELGRQQPDRLNKNVNQQSQFRHQTPSSAHQQPSPLYPTLALHEAKQQTSLPPANPTTSDVNPNQNAIVFPTTNGFHIMPTRQLSFVQACNFQQQSNFVTRPPIQHQSHQSLPQLPNMTIPTNVHNPMHAPPTQIHFGGMTMPLSQFSAIPIQGANQSVVIPSPSTPKPQLDATSLNNLFTLCRNNEAPQLRQLLQSLRERGLFSSADELICENRNLTHTAAHTGQHHIINMLVTEFGANPNACSLDPPGWTALHFAANRGQELCCETLLKLSVNPNVHGKADNLTPIHLAVRGNHVRCVQVLVRHPHCNVNEPGGPHHDTVFHMIARMPCSNELIKIIVSKGASFCMQNSLGNTPFHSLLLSTQLDDIGKHSKLVLMFNDLKERPCDFNAKNKSQLSVLNAVKQCSADVANTFQTFYNARCASQSNSMAMPTMFPPNTLGLPPLNDIAMTPSPPPHKPTKEESVDAGHGSHVGVKRRSPEQSMLPAKRQRLGDAPQQPDNSLIPTSLQPLILPGNGLRVPQYIIQPLARTQQQSRATPATLSFLSDATSRSEGPDDLDE